jgi:tellurite resistance protein TehA-like permease
MWLLPIVSLIVAAATGAVVAEHLDPARARLTAQFWSVFPLTHILAVILTSSLRIAT